LVAFSRVYLLQHFFIDTYFGAEIGIITAILVYYYIDYRSNIPANSTIQQPLLKVFGKK
jgi:membrane-associated phospholipid phosphatase